MSPRQDEKHKRSFPVRTIANQEVAEDGVGQMPNKAGARCKSVFRYFCHIRNPPRKAFSLLPSSVPGGSFFNFLLFPPPSTT